MTIGNKAALALTAVLMIGAMARAEDTSPNITLTGHASATESPEALRLSLTISAQGSDIRAAIAKLKQERDDAKGKLVAIGANESAIKFTDPAEGTQGNLTPQQRMMQQMMATQRNRATPASQPSGVTVSTQLTAEWTLASASPDDLLIAANELERKVKGALAAGGGSATAAKTPEEEEIAQEMAAQPGADAGKSDQPQFVFVHKLTEDDRAKLLGEAFANAQAQAKRLAIAAGRQSGGVMRISGNQTDMENPQNAYIQAIMDAQTGQATPTSSDDEVVGDAPGTVRYNVSVGVTFLLQ
jgi:uncharacterized protein YggE